MTALFDVASSDRCWRSEGGQWQLSAAGADPAPQQPPGHGPAGGAAHPRGDGDRRQQHSGRLQLELRRTANLTLGKQAWWYAMSAEALVIKVLNQDFKDDPDRVSLGQNWARQDGVFPVEDGTLSGRVRDLQSCFNLNSLSVPLKEGRTATISRPSLTSSKVFRALLAQLEVDDYEAVQLTDAIRDWTDKDTQLVSSNGAEDAYYEGLNPPYLVANQRMLGTDELRAVRGVSASLYARLAPMCAPCPMTSWW
jgi:general secretion pathway protein K